MDTSKQSHSLNYDSTLPVAQLWIGQHERTIEEIILFLQKILCSYQACQICTSCIQIRHKQHHAIMWLYPEKTYTIDQLEALFTTISYALQPGELFFFIIQKADLLTTACANKLLKPIEEPPQGYHFILLADHTEYILPTILSRCITYKINDRHDYYTNHLLFECFTNKSCSMIEFSKIIDSTSLTEKECLELCNEILHYWMQELKKNINENLCKKNLAIISILKEIYVQPIMPGSTSIFWHNLYFKLYHLITS